MQIGHRTPDRTFYGTFDRTVHLTSSYTSSGSASGHARSDGRRDWLTFALQLTITPATVTVPWDTRGPNRDWAAKQEKGRPGFRIRDPEDEKVGKLLREREGERETYPQHDLHNTSRYLYVKTPSLLCGLCACPISHSATSSCSCSSLSWLHSRQIREVSVTWTSF